MPSGTIGAGAPRKCRLKAARGAAPGASRLSTATSVSLCPLGSDTALPTWAMKVSAPGASVMPSSRPFRGPPTVEESRRLVEPLSQASRERRNAFPPEGDLTLRPERDDEADRTFLYALFAAIRAAEMSATPLDAAARDF